MWVVADCSVESIVFVIAWSLSGCSVHSGRHTPPLGVTGRDSGKFRRRADNVLDRDDHGRNAIVLAVVVIWGERRQQSKGCTGDIVFVVIIVVLLTTQRKRRLTTKMVRRTIVCSRSPTMMAATVVQEQ